VNVTCQVGIHAQQCPPSEAFPMGLRFRAYALECETVLPWRREMTDAEIDALRLDGHECPLERRGHHQRLIPRDRLVTKRDALYAPASALRYLPSNE
jgi:hypothetical protein